MSKTLIKKATSFNSIYSSEPNSPQKTKVTTNGKEYHDRLNKAHQSLLDEEIMTDSVIGSTNFLTAEIVFIIQTKAKRIPISFPIFTGQAIYNYQNLPNIQSHPTTSQENFKTFLENARTKTKKILGEANLKLDCSMAYIEQSPSYYCQKAYHTEKFFFHYLRKGGLKKVVELFPSKSITPETLVSIDAVELRMHSTRDMCHTCESLTIAEKASLKTKLNELLTSRHYPELPEDFKCKVIMSFNKKSSERAGKLDQNTVDIRSKLISNPQLESPKSYLNLHRYTCFTSGGSSPSDQNKREKHIDSAIKTKDIAEKATFKIETKAAKIIQRSFRRHRNRRLISSLKLIYKFKDALKTKVFKMSKYIIKIALSLSNRLSTIKTKNITQSKPQNRAKTVPVTTVNIPSPSKAKPAAVKFSSSQVGKPSNPAKARM